MDLFGLFEAAKQHGWWEGISQELWQKACWCCYCSWTHMVKFSPPLQLSEGLIPANPNCCHTELGHYKCMPYFPDFLESSKLLELKCWWCWILFILYPKWTAFLSSRFFLCCVGEFLSALSTFFFPNQRIR